MVAYVDDVATDPDESRSSIQAVARPGQRHRQGVTKHGVGDNRTGVDDGVSSSDRGEVGGDGGEGVHAGVHGGRGRRGGAGGGERGDGGTVTATVSVVWEDGSEEDGVPLSTLGEISTRASAGVAPRVGGDGDSCAPAGALPLRRLLWPPPLPSSCSLLPPPRSPTPRACLLCRPRPSTGWRCPLGWSTTARWRSSSTSPASEA